MVGKTGEAFGMDFTDWIVQLGVAFLLLNEIFVISKEMGLMTHPWVQLHAFSQALWYKDGLDMGYSSQEAFSLEGN